MQQRYSRIERVLRLQVGYQAQFTMEDDRQETTPEVQPMWRVPSTGKIWSQDSKSEDGCSLSHRGMCMQEVSECYVF